jgi:hypothetical protein
MADVDDEFKKAVRSYVDLHDQKRVLAQKAKEVNKQLHEFEDAILRYMQQQDIEGCKLPDGGKLLRRQARRVEGVKLPQIKEALKSMLGEQQADAVMLDIVGKRAVNTVEKLRRTRTRGAPGGGTNDA